MPAKPRVRVVAAYEIAAVAAQYLEKLLREEVPQHISCTFLEATIHAEQVQFEDEIEGGGREQQGDGLEAEPRDAGEDGELAGAAGAGEQEPGGGDADDGLSRAVPSQGEGDVAEPAAAGDVADSGAREGTGESIDIVPEGD